MGFHVGLEEEVVRQAVAEDYLRIKPAIGIASAAGIKEVVSVENAFVLYSARGGGFGFVCGFQFFDGVKQVEADVEACGELPDDELRLKAHTQAPAVGGFSGSEVGLAEKSLALFVGAVVEEVESSAKAEDGMCEPIGSHLELTHGEGGLVAVIDLASTGGEGELERPRFRASSALPTQGGGKWICI